MFGSSAKSTYDRNVEKATSHLLLEPDWEATLQICDAIRQKDVTPKYALANMRKKMFDKNPRVTLYALQVLESCVKNCGTGIHEEVATPQFMDDMKELASSSNEAVKSKTLELLQAWAHAFRNEPSLKIVCDTFSQLKAEGHTFPQLKESDAMFVAEKAPDWVEGERCYTCRTEFGLMQRQHHCRHCGQVFCGKCSSKSCTIPKFGIEKPVRVCDTCHDKLQGGGSGGSSGAKPGNKESDLPDEYLNSPLSQQSQLPPQRNDLDLQEEEELQLAMALSLDEAQNKHLIKGKSGSSVSSAPMSSPTPAYNTGVSSAPAPEPELDPELARYLNRSYWEQKQEENRGTMPSAPTGGADVVPATAPPLSQSTSSQPMYAQVKTFEETQNGAVEPEYEEFMRNMSSSIDVLVNRMKSDSSRGRSIASDTTVQGLFQVLSSMHPRLIKILQEKEEKRAQMEGLQDKLAQIRDAREALDALREEHREKLRREAEEAERQRQIQMAQKLEIMRRKKQEMLQFQQQQALLRMQEKERERQMWLEQQKQQQQMRQIQYTYGMQQGMGQPGMMPPGGMVPGAGGVQQGPPGQYGQPPQYGSPSHAPYGMAPPPSGYPGGPPPVTTQMDGGQPTTQTPQLGYNQAPAGYQLPHQQQQQVPPQQQPYQPPMGGGGYPSGQYGAPPSMPPQQHGASMQQQQQASMPPSQAYSPLSSLDYPQQQQPPHPPQQQQQQQPQQQPPSNPYNMQAMTGALPPGQMPPPPGQMPPQQQQGQYAPPQQQPQQQYAPQGQQMMGSPSMQMVPPGMQPPPQQQQQVQQPPQPDQAQEATLISFE
ncbi:hepatocyte growth factor-regulated tyrosine kinase substrate-like [Diadema setosum]|uniref:hepatocyte growth factor-regulated tyrosine kinase substrate-like n=1 Tax=Diadema setosum TaxID=31175 RepID=UPI003B3BCE13